MNQFGVNIEYAFNGKIRGNMRQRYLMICYILNIKNAKFRGGKKVYHMLKRMKAAYYKLSKNAKSNKRFQIIKEPDLSIYAKRSTVKTDKTLQDHMSEYVKLSEQIKKLLLFVNSSPVQELNLSNIPADLKLKMENEQEVVMRRSRLMSTVKQLRVEVVKCQDKNDIIGEMLISKQIKGLTDLHDIPSMTTQALEFTLDLEEKIYPKLTKGSTVPSAAEVRSQLYYSNNLTYNIPGEYENHMDRTKDNKILLELLCDVESFKVEIFNHQRNNPKIDTPGIEPAVDEALAILKIQLRRAEDKLYKHKDSYRVLIKPDLDDIEPNDDFEVTLQKDIDEKERKEFGEALKRFTEAILTKF
jgi:hypothetical protein